MSIAPIWNTIDPFHNAVITSMLDGRKAMSIKHLHRLLGDLESYPVTYESFRKMFRALENWLEHLPCFKKEYGRGQRFVLDV